MLASDVASTWLAEHRGDRLGAALVRHDVELGAVLGLQHARDEMRRAAGAGGGPVEALRRLLRGGDELLQVLVGRIGRHQDHRGRQADHRDRHQVARPCTACVFLIMLLETTPAALIRKV